MGEYYYKKMFTLIIIFIIKRKYYFIYIKSKVKFATKNVLFIKQYQ